MYAEVAVDFADADRLRTYTYLTPRSVEVQQGDLVWVPFGHRPIQGVVMDVSSESGVEGPRPVESLVDGGPFLSTTQLELVRWISTYYRTSLFKSAEVLLPPGTTSRLRIWISRTSKASETETSLEAIRLTEAQRAILADVPRSGRIRRDRLSRSTSSARNRNIEALVREGYLTAESIWDRPTVKPRLVRHIRLSPSADPSEAMSRYTRRNAHRRVALVNALSRSSDGMVRARATRDFGVAVVKAVIDDGVANEYEVRIDRDPLADYAAQENIEHELTPDQSDCVDAITASINERGQSQRFLLHGVTGSGKTEVYLRAVRECIKSGKRAIVMVPEIAMTPQMLQRFASRFPGRIALQHSGLSLGQRYDQWHKIKSGSYDVILGSRSSIFAPVSSLGLVVIDEEHEWTFKQSDRAPKYHARDVAEQLCEISGATLLVGSATPDLTTYHRSSPSSTSPATPYRRLTLPRRINEALNGTARNSTYGDYTSTQPSGTEVSIVDMRGEFASGHRELISRELLTAMRENTELERKTILFINRRGSASFVQCTNCGAIRKCPNCKTSLTLHRQTRGGRGSRLQCHYCGYSVGANRRCRVCNGTGVGRRATGTEGAEDAVKSFFPNTQVLRWDSDTARNSKEHAKILEQFQADGSKILVGTQMVAKGLDIPSVGLVGVLAADISLAIPSYRAPERTFQLIAQVVGRAGRADLPGRAIIQTFLPDSVPIMRGAVQDYTGFYESELSIRQESALPPFVRHAKLSCSRFEEEDARAEAASVVTRLRAWCSEHRANGLTIIGPTPAFPFRRAGKFRYHIFLSIENSPTAEFNSILDAVELGAPWIVEIDPLDMS